MNKTKIIVFSDLDGTLLNHDDYSYHDAIPTLKRLRDSQIPLILSSSKTKPEICDFRLSMDNDHPFIVENGGAIFIPKNYFYKKQSEQEYSIKYFSKEYDAIIRFLKDIRDKYQFEFKGFSDYSEKELAAITGLSIESAIKAKQRTCSEPIRWLGDQESFNRFSQIIIANNYSITKGGRFVHVMGKTDKSKGVKWLINRYKEKNPDSKYLSIALGDSHNDKEMLEIVDIAIVIKPVNNDPPKLSGSNRVIYSDQEGSKGWNHTMQKILDEYCGKCL